MLQSMTRLEHEILSISKEGLAVKALDFPRGIPGEVVLCAACRFSTVVAVSFEADVMACREDPCCCLHSCAAFVGSFSP